MKNLVIILFAVIAPFVVQAQKKSFEIKGHLKGLNADRVTFRMYDGEDADAASVTLNGENISFEGECEYPVVAVVGHNDRKAFNMGKLSGIFVVVSPGATLTLDGKISNYNEVYCESDAENRALSKMHKEVFPLLSESSLLSSKIRRDSTLSESEVNTLKAKATELSNRAMETQKRMIAENPSSVGALWYLDDMLIRSQIKAEEVEKIIVKVDPKYHNHPYYLLLKMKVKGAKESVVGQIVPDVVSDLTYDGESFDLKSLRGKYVIIDFWGTWCGPCIFGMPQMREYRDKYEDKLQIVGIANDPKMDKWRAHITKNDLNWPNIFNGKGELDFVAKFNVAGYPTKLIIDPDGKIIYRGTGESEEFYEILDKYLK